MVRLPSQLAPPVPNETVDAGGDLLDGLHFCLGSCQWLRRHQYDEPPRAATYPACSDLSFGAHGAGNSFVCISLSCLVFRRHRNAEKLMPLTTKIVHGRLPGMKKPLAILLNFFVSLTSALGTDIPMFRGNPQHTGVVADSATPKGGAFLNPKWRFQTDGRIRSSAALVNGVVYFGSDDGYLYAVKASDGTLVWKLKTGGAVSSSPAVEKGLVYFMSRDGVFRAVETKSGNLKWTFPTGPELPFQGGWDWFLSSPVLSEESVVFGAGDGFVYALDSLSGNKRWTFKTAGRVRATPAIANGTVYAGSMDGTLYALDLKSGELKWKFKTEGNQYFPLGEIQSSPAVADGTGFFGGRDGCL